MSPFDDREAADQADIIGWIDSGAPLFRTAKPATPPRHLAVYAALLDEAEHSVMLVDHRKAQLWVLPGGHVDDGEDPQRSVQREVLEELGISPGFHESVGQPSFLSVTQTRGADSHTDVTLWFLVKGDSSAEVHPDLAEFTEARWHSLDRTDWSQPRFDPQMNRFIRKLSSALPTRSAGGPGRPLPGDGERRVWGRDKRTELERVLASGASAVMRQAVTVG